MDSSIIVAIVAGVATVTGAAIGLVKKNQGKVASVSNTNIGDHAEVDMTNASESNIAIGSNITQTYERSTHNYYGSALPAAWPSGGMTASRPTLSEIRSGLQAAKPFERHQICDNHKGLHVSWPVKFASLNTGRSGWVAVFYDPEGSSQSVCADIDLENYPKLKVIDVGHDAWIEGQIEDIHETLVFLKANPTIVIE